MRYQWMVGILLFVSVNSQASTIVCHIATDPSATLSVDVLDKNSVNTIDYTRKVKLADGSFMEKTDRLFQRYPLIRGMFAVDYCNPNDNEYRDYSDQYYISSSCNSTSGDPVGFMATLGVNKQGRVEFSDSDISWKTLSVSSCD